MLAGLNLLRKIPNDDRIGIAINDKIEHFCFSDKKNAFAISIEPFCWKYDGKIDTFQTKRWNGAQMRKKENA